MNPKELRNVPFAERKRIAEQLRRCRYCGDTFKYPNLHEPSCKALEDRMAASSKVAVHFEIDAESRKKI